MIEESDPIQVAHCSVFAGAEIERYALHAKTQLIGETEKANDWDDHELAADRDMEKDLGHDRITEEELLAPAPLQMISASTHVGANLTTDCKRPLGSDSRSPA